MKKILVVDDDPKISKALTEFFNPDHFEIDSIIKGSKAIRIISDLSPDRGISKEASEFQTNYPWPGNVRELENNVDTAVVISKDGILLPEHFLALHEKGAKISIDF